MNIYKYIKFAVSGHIPNRVKLLGLWALFIGRRRMIGVFFDPVMACNLRCKMCYMSDPDRCKEMTGEKIMDNYLDRLADALYDQTLKLQIGCANEPTLYNGLERIISHAKRHGVPYVSITTNGKLIAQERVDLMKLVESGLDEMTLSLHGTSKEIYEELMVGAKFDELKALTKKIAKVKNRFPKFILRVNYTINSLNIDDLKDDRFWELWEKDGLPDIIQLRPVQNMGKTAWNDFNLSPLKEKYDHTIGAIIQKCAEKNIVCIAPKKNQIDEVATDQDFYSGLITKITYCYVSPTSMYAPDFREDDTFIRYHKRKKTAKNIFKAIFSNNRKSIKRDSSKHLNYTIR